MLAEVYSPKASAEVLNWLVAQIEGVRVGVDIDTNQVFFSEYYKRYNPSGDWAQCGPIIEKACIGLVPGRTQWFANSGFTATSPTVAAMRAYVTDRLGYIQMVPEVLLTDEDRANECLIAIEKERD